MKVVYSKYIPFKGFKALTIYPFIFVRRDETMYDYDYNHEYIHAHQQKEMIWVFFFLWYGIEWIIRLVQYKDGDKAYRNISFEREAYQKQYYYGYLKKRKFWGWIKYL